MNDKRKKAENTILKLINDLDPSGANAEVWKIRFNSMSDKSLKFTLILHYYLRLRLLDFLSEEFLDLIVIYYYYLGVLILNLLIDKLYEFIFVYHYYHISLYFCLLKTYFARKRVSKLRSPLRMMNYIRRSSSELIERVMSLIWAIWVRPSTTQALYLLVENPRTYNPYSSHSTHSTVRYLRWM